MVLDQAKWVWCPHLEGKNAYADFKQELHAEKGTQAEIAISVDGNYALY